MKKQFTLTTMSLFFSLLLCAQTQITKAYTLDGGYYNGFTKLGIWGDPHSIYNNAQYLNGAYTYPTYYDYSIVDILSGCLFYQTYYDEQTNIIGIKKYDENFQVIENKVVVRNVPHFDNYTPNISGVNNITAKLFNDDNNYEILISYTLNEGTFSELGYEERRNMEQKLLLVNENGTILQDFGMAAYLSSGNAICQYKNKWYYSVVKYIYVKEQVEGQTYTRTVAEYITDIYQIGKQSIQGLSQVSSSHIPAYPNPAISEIYIPTPNGQGIRIYDMNGRLVDSRSGNGEVVNVNVSGYPSGNYIYQTQGNSGVFIKQ